MRPADYNCWRWRPASEPPSEGRWVLVAYTAGAPSVAWSQHVTWAFADRWRDLPDDKADAEHAALVARVAELEAQLAVAQTDLSDWYKHGVKVRGQSAAEQAAENRTRLAKLASKPRRRK